MAFESQIRVHFDEADPAGIAFFAVIYSKIHRCYEDFISSLGIDLKQWFLNPEMITPLRHLETQFFKPLLPFENYQVQIDVSEIRDNSFQLKFTIHQDGHAHCQVLTTHVCVDKAAMKKSALPESLRLKLETHLLN